MIARYAITDQWAAALRTEYYQDPTEIIIQPGSANGFKTAGLSLNIDYSPTSNMFCRLEGRWLNSQDKIFTRKDNLARNNVFIATSIAMRFDK